jgi:DNA-binding SARP family transcriptional activator
MHHGTAPQASADEDRSSVLTPARSASSRPSEKLGRLFDEFPYGILLLASDRSALDINSAATKMLGLSAETAAPGALTCCDLFGCRTPGTSLERRCLTEMALADKLPPGEIRIDLPPGAGATAVWLTAALLRSDPQRVLVHLRRSDRRDRRRVNVPIWESDTELEIFTLGRTRIVGAGGSLNGPWLRQRPGMLLKYLICERRRLVPADEIAEAFWPGGDQRAVGNVRHFVHSLRSNLEPGRAKRTPSRFIIAEPGGYRLNTEAVTVDADEFQQLVTAGLQRLKHEDQEASERLLVDAMVLYGGDFLGDERYALWAFAERDRLRDLAGEALHALGGLRHQAGDLEGAAAYLERRADMYPLDADIQRDLIALALEQGRHTLAKRRYAALRRRLLSEFGREPSFDLHDLAASVSNGQDQAAGSAG